ncbi:unnamed protein product [Amoebophrya sp. A120]|nr:unnamed protein product [Amoebophrya sp. A120]|eukprot:GSA120T00024454001.1
MERIVQTFMTGLGFRTSPQTGQPAVEEAVPKVDAADNQNCAAKPAEDYVQISCQANSTDQDEHKKMKEDDPCCSSLPVPKCKRAKVDEDHGAGKKVEDVQQEPQEHSGQQQQLLVAADQQDDMEEDEEVVAEPNVPKTFHRNAVTMWYWNQSRLISTFMLGETIVLALTHPLPFMEELLNYLKKDLRFFTPEGLPKVVIAGRELAVAFLENSTAAMRASWKQSVKDLKLPDLREKSWKTSRSLGAFAKWLQAFWREFAQPVGSCILLKARKSEGGTHRFFSWVMKVVEQEPVYRMGIPHRVVRCRGFVDDKFARELQPHRNANCRLSDAKVEKLLAEMTTISSSKGCSGTSANPSGCSSK